jgi:hypothetical protein
LRSDVLGQLHEYEAAAAREQAAGRSVVEPAQVWDEPRETPVTLPAASTQPSEQVTALDEWRRRFSPTGVIVRGVLDTEHWLTFGRAAELPLFAAGSRVLVSKSPVQTPVRFADARRLRLGGLLWPEAGARLENSAYLTTERVERGQVVLFAQEPNFRGYWHGTRRLLANAVLLGPGCGTSQPPAQ